MADIVLATLNARFVHAALGLRCLQANLDELQPRSRLLEFDISQRPVEIAEAILREQPRILGLGVSIWNVVPTTELTAILKQLRPTLMVILGGPELQSTPEQHPITALADFVIFGEADLEFARLCRRLLAGNKPATRILMAEPPDLAQLVLPYRLYTPTDIEHRLIYVEASRGCPFRCEFCLSSTAAPLRFFPLPKLLEEFQWLLNQGVRHFKFVDRTFNLNLEMALAVLRFFLDRCQPGLFLHFEMIPDRLPDELGRLIARFPPGALQFEIGIQTFNPEVARRIQRHQDYALLERHFQFLRRRTHAHLHADLIVGLPGETIESIGRGFDRLVALEPQEIQVGLLKRLPGAPIARHDSQWQMTYNPWPPYEILENRLIDFGSMQRLRRFARYWDLVANSGRFPETTPLLWTTNPSPFQAFLLWSDWLYAQIGRQHSIALARLAELLFRFLVQETGQDPSVVGPALWRDLARGQNKTMPGFLQAHAPANGASAMPRPTSMSPKRQSRHEP